MKKIIILLLSVLIVTSVGTTIYAQRNSETADPQYSVISVYETGRIPRTKITCDYAGYTYFHGAITATTSRRSTDNGVLNCSYSIKLYNLGGEDALGIPIQLSVTNKSYYVSGKVVHATFKVNATAGSYTNSISFDIPIQ